MTQPFVGFLCQWGKLERMKPGKFDLGNVADALQERCPFILFAMINGLDDHGQPGWLKNPEVSVFIDPATSCWQALEKILPVMAVASPGVFFEVTMLNRVDVETRFRATQGVCLFVRQDMLGNYTNFIRQAGLDHRIMRARGRKSGIIDNC